MIHCWISDPGLALGVWDWIKSIQQSPSNMDHLRKILESYCCCTKNTMDDNIFLWLPSTFLQKGLDSNRFVAQVPLFFCLTIIFCSNLKILQAFLETFSMKVYQFLSLIRVLFLLYTSWFSWFCYLYEQKSHVQIILVLTLRCSSQKLYISSQLLVQNLKIASTHAQI